jgi:hypothetical protein
MKLIGQIKELVNKVKEKITLHRFYRKQECEDKRKQVTQERSWREFECEESDRYFEKLDCVREKEDRHL